MLLGPETNEPPRRRGDEASPCCDVGSGGADAEPAEGVRQTGAGRVDGDGAESDEQEECALLDIGPSREECGLLEPARPEPSPGGAAGGAPADEEEEEEDGVDPTPSPAGAAPGGPPRAVAIDLTFDDAGPADGAPAADARAGPPAAAPPGDAGGRRPEGPGSDEGQVMDVCPEDIVRRMRRLRGTSSSAGPPPSSQRGDGAGGAFESAASMANLGRVAGDDPDAFMCDPDAKESSLRAAEVELESKFRKSDFALLRVVGQFNLGFIICCLRNNVFIIDQHAADEKANYERLEANTVLKRQPLIVPAPLDVSAADEVMLLENRELFRKNGFEFFEDHAGRVGRRVLLKAVPYSKGIVFGPDDVRELLAQLQGIGEGHVDSRTVVPRPSRVRTMLASRACRYSIMIGRHLDRKQMAKVVFNLSTLRSPWNCPHGRPTMRHLVSLAALNASDRHACVGVEL